MWNWCRWTVSGEREYSRKRGKSGFEACAEIEKQGVVVDMLVRERLRIPYRNVKRDWINRECAFMEWWNYADGKVGDGGFPPAKTTFSNLSSSSRVEKLERKSSESSSATK